MASPRANDGIESREHVELGRDLGLHVVLGRDRGLGLEVIAAAVMPSSARQAGVAPPHSQPTTGLNADLALDTQFALHQR